MMRVRGEIYSKRSYLDKTLQKTMNILFIKADESINFNGDLIKFIPIISECSANFSVGEKIQLEGEISTEYIVTSLGKRSFEPVPVIRTRSIS
ncbi:hypothetical protein [Metabacillus arenae]|uniref:Uncharacterized protein n=1 Tax=Metabacillus arenae TaxID=2771434 RepID=A0A926NHK7_9BACI|nr:hypothetical protein [Metabacillus arenae]MBD1383609.1 hypothetical protein [Metabacillus arenae]